MNTHTIRWNGTKAHKIVTFTPQYLKILESSHRDAVSLIIGKMLKDLKGLTGITHKLDYNIETVINSYFQNKNSINNDGPRCDLKRWFEHGYLNSTIMDCEKDIKTLNLFYNTFFNFKEKE